MLVSNEWEVWKSFEGAEKFNNDGAYVGKKDDDTVPMKTRGSGVNNTDREAML